MPSRDPDAVDAHNKSSTSQPLELNKQSTQIRLLAAAVQEFLSPTYPIFQSITLSHLARRAGISERTAFRHTSTEQIHQALPGYLLDVNPTEDSGGDTFTEMLEDIASNVSTSIAELIEVITQKAFETLQSDRAVLAQFALAPYAAGDPAVREALSAYYRRADRRSRRVVNTFVATNAGRLQFRDDLMSVDDLAAIISVFFDGLALRSQVDRAVGNEEDSPFNEELAANLVKILIATMMGSTTESSGEPITTQLSILDEHTYRDSQKPRIDT